MMDSALADDVLAVVVNGDLVLYFDRSKRLPGVQRRFLDDMDASMESGIEFDGTRIVRPDLNIRGQYVANAMLNALLKERDQHAGAMCSWLATRLPDLKIVKALSDDEGMRIELVFDKTYQQWISEKTVKFVKLN